MSSLSRLLRYFDPADPGFARRLTRLAAAVVLGSASLGCGVILRWSTTPLGRYGAGILLLQARLYAPAARVAEGLIRDYPRENVAYYRLAERAYRGAGRSADVVRVLQSGAAAFPDSWYLQTQLCWYTALFADPRQAMSACEAGVALAKPHEGAGLLLRGFARARAGDLPGALADIEAGLEKAQLPENAGKRMRHDWADWLNTLQRGEDPFTPEVLERLRRHP